MKIKDIEGARTLQIDGRNSGSPQSVFVMGGSGFCIEVDRQAFLEGIRTEFNLVPVAFASLTLVA